MCSPRVQLELICESELWYPSPPGANSSYNLSGRPPPTCFSKTVLPKGPSAILLQLQYRGVGVLAAHHPVTYCSMSCALHSAANRLFSLPTRASQFPDST